MNRINIICLGVKDVKQSRSFYQELFGFTTPNTEENPDIVFFSNKGTKLEIFPLGELAKDINEENPPATGSGFGGITLAFNAKTQEEADAIYAKAEKLGAEIVKTPRRVFWGGYSGYIKDINGYYWEVAFFEGWKFDENDMLVIE